MQRCCVECFDDPFLRACIREQGVPGNCPYCESTGVMCADLELVGNLVRGGLSRAYREAREEAGPYDSVGDAYGWMDPRKAPTLLETLRDREIVFSKKLGTAADRLLKDLLDASAPRPPRVTDQLEPDVFGDLDTPLYPKDAFSGVQDSLFDSSWEAFKFQVQHVARFFDGRALGAPREVLLSRVRKQLQKLEVALPAGTRLFRARVVAEGTTLPSSLAEQARELGPPPVRRSKSGRMNPSGISYTYLTLEPETALAEVRAGGGEKCWVGEFATRVALMIVDLSLTSGNKPSSIFDPGYDHEHRLLLPSLRAFAREISKEVSANDEALDYVPTQVLTEFLRSRGAHGVQYRSARSGQGMNVTLFCGRPLEEEGVAPNLSLDSPDEWGKGFTPFTEWLEFKSAREHPRTWLPTR